MVRCGTPVARTVASGTCWNEAGKWPHSNSPFTSAATSLQRNRCEWPLSTFDVLRRANSPGLLIGENIEKRTGRDDSHAFVLSNV
jgi:hypothetical protein